MIGKMPGGDAPGGDAEDSGVVVAVGPHRDGGLAVGRRQGAMVEPLEVVGPDAEAVMTLVAGVHNRPSPVTHVNVALGAVGGPVMEQLEEMVGKRFKYSHFYYSGAYLQVALHAAEVVEIDLAGPAPQDNNYATWRAQALAHLRHLVRRREIVLPDDGQLLQEVASIRERTVEVGLRDVTPGVLEFADVVALTLHPLLRGRRRRVQWA